MNDSIFWRRWVKPTFNYIITKDSCVSDIITPGQMAKLAREAGQPISELDGANKDSEGHLEEWIEQHKEGLANIGKGSDIGSLLDRVNKFNQKLKAISINDNPTYEAKLKGLFDSASHPNHDSIIGRGYDYVDPIARKSILFIGMNPSYGTPQPGYTNPDDQLKYMYFRPIHKILEYVNNATHTDYGFAYIDLYYVRETSQKRVEEMEKAMPVFFRDQLSITKQIIAAAKPKLIVVVNAAASKRFQQEYQQNWLRYDMRKGADIYKIASDQVPVLFSGMLSGQRALDNGSFKSLKWHIVHILSQQSY